MDIANDSLYVAETKASISAKATNFKLKAVSTSCGSFNAESQCNDTYSKGEQNALKYGEILTKVAQNMQAVSNALETADTKVAAAN